MTWKTLTGASPPAARRLPLIRDRSDDVRPALLIALQGHELVLGRILEELTERGVAVVALVEGGVLPDHRLLHHGAPEDLLVFALERLDRVDQLRERFGLLFRDP